MKRHYLAWLLESCDKLNKNCGRDAILGRLRRRSPNESFLDITWACLQSETFTGFPLSASGKPCTPFPSFEDPRIRLVSHAFPPEPTCEELLVSGLKSCVAEGSFCRRQQRELTLDMRDCSSEANVSWESLNRYWVISSRIHLSFGCFPGIAGFEDVIFSEIRCSIWLTRSLTDIDGWRPGTLIWSQSLRNFELPAPRLFNSSVATWAQVRPKVTFHNFTKFLGLKRFMFLYLS